MRLAKPAAKIGRGLHVDGHAAHRAQALLEGLVVLPHAAVGRVDRAGPVVVARGRGSSSTPRAAARTPAARAPAAAGSRRWCPRRGSPRSAAPGRRAGSCFFSPPHLPRNSTAFGHDRADSRSIIVAAFGLPMPKLIMVMPSCVAAGHRAVQADHGCAGQCWRSCADVAAEVGQQDVFAELVQGHAGVARQPVVDDLFLVFHGIGGWRFGSGKSIRRRMRGSEPCVFRGSGGLAA